MANEDDILRDAIIGTEKEIAASAFERDEGAHDETGDRSLESMGAGLEGQHEPEDDDAEDPDDGADDDAHPSDEPENPDEVAAKAEKEPEPKVEAPKEPQGRVPAGRLREEAEGKRAAIAERDAFKAQLDTEKAERLALNAKLDAVLALQKAPAPQPTPTPQPEKPKIPDLFEDPAAFAEYLLQRQQQGFEKIQRDQRDQQVNASINDARARHGQVFNDAWEALSTLPKNQETVELVRKLEASSNPGDAVVSWHKRNVAAREVGDDLDGFKARIAEETRKQLMADPEFRKSLIGSLREDATVGDQGRPRSEVRLPRSLSQTSGSNARTPANYDSDGSESAIAASAWS